MSKHLNGTLPLDAITYDTTIYPREAWKTSTVDRYVDGLKRGDSFPPLVIEQGATRLLDGVHRWKAYQKYAAQYAERMAQPELMETEYDRREDWAPPLQDIPVEYHTIPEGIPAILYAAMLSVTHGDRITNAERKALARKLYTANPDFSLHDLEAYLHISTSTAGDYVSDLRAQRKEGQKILAYRLHRLGWTQEEIGEAIGVSRPNVSRDFVYQFPELENDTKKLLAENFPHLHVAERFNLPLILVHAIDLDGRTDKERCKRLNITLQPYDVWTFGACHELFGADWPGRIPGQLVAHVLYFFTDPGAMVIDPMAGSGTTVDVCLAMGRKCYAYDLNVEHQRPDISAHDILTDGWPARVSKANLIFWDPPYFDKKDDLYAPGSISALDAPAYQAFFLERFRDAYKLVRKGTRLAFLMSDWDDDTGTKPLIALWHYAAAMEQAGWTLLRRIDCPLSTQQVHPDIVQKFRASRRLARLNRSLLVGEKR